MAGEREPLGKQGLDARRAAFDIKHPATRGTFKMMMVVFPSRLIAVWFTGQGHSLQPTFLDAEFDGAIDRCLAEAWDFLLSGIENFLRAQRPIFVFDDLTNGFTLFGIALFSHVENLACVEDGNKAG